MLAGLIAWPGGLGAEPRLSARHVLAFLQFFDTLALSPDFGPFNNRPAWVRKWNGPVRVFLSREAEPLRNEVKALVGRISRWTGLSFTVAPAGATAQPSTENVITLRVIQRTDAERHFTDDDIVCQTETHGLGGALHTGFIILSEAYKDCLKHEFMHALGFDSHWRTAGQAAIRSVLAFRDSANRTGDFSRWDVMAIRLLYDQRIHAGMPRQTGLALAARLIEEPPQRAELKPQPIMQPGPLR